MLGRFAIKFSGEKSDLMDVVSSLEKNWNEDHPYAICDRVIYDGLSIKVSRTVKWEAFATGYFNFPDIWDECLDDLIETSRARGLLVSYFKATDDFKDIRIDNDPGSQVNIEAKVEIEEPRWVCDARRFRQIM
jgi:hypothetical protein